MSGRHPNVQVSLAAFPGQRHECAAHLAVQLHAAGVLSEPAVGPLRVDHLQLVPQSYGVLTPALAEQLRSDHPSVAFRLHANVRVTEDYRVVDLSNMFAPVHEPWLHNAAQISQRLGARAYTAHAGYRHQASLAQMLDNARRAADVFGCPVGVEGLYPSPRADYLVSTWVEYRAVFESGVPYAVDLSHLNIVQRAEGRAELSLVREMLASERCIEVHVSSNDGTRDLHQICEEPAWWADLLDHVHPAAVVFSEGNHRPRVRALMENDPVDSQALEPSTDNKALTF
ncbi:MAG: hypothetical protein KGL39_21605 [Patescibacteria group bacterium]|nr:hypothetical protein [Patescibacteria group bacterium]